MKARRAQNLLWLARGGAWFIYCREVRVYYFPIPETALVDQWTELVNKGSVETASRATSRCDLCRQRPNGRRLFMLAINAILGQATRQDG